MVAGTFDELVMDLIEAAEPDPRWGGIDEYEPILGIRNGLQHGQPGAGTSEAAGPNSVWPGRERHRRRFEHDRLDPIPPGGGHDDGPHGPRVDKPSFRHAGQRSVDAARPSAAQRSDDVPLPSAIVSRPAPPAAVATPPPRASSPAASRARRAARRKSAGPSHQSPTQPVDKAPSANA